MRVLLATTEELIKGGKSQISVGVNAGTSVAITLISVNRFAVNDYIVIGIEGSEIAEICEITNITGNVVTVGSLAHNHDSDEPVTKYRYNQRKFYGSIVSGGSYVELTGYGSPVNIQVDNPQGTVLEYTGNEGYLYFKSTYYNSHTGEESSIVDSNEVLADESGRYCSLYAIRKAAGLTDNAYVPDGRVEEKRKQAEGEVNSFIFSKYILPLSYIPPLIERIAVLLGSGYLDFEEFGADGEGKKWLGEARGLLKAIADGRQRLIGADGISELITNAKTEALSGYPDSTVGPEDPDATKFKMSDKY